MKRFTKVCLITSLVLILIGGTICTIGAVSGGFRLVNEMDRGEKVWDLLNRVEAAYDLDHFSDRWRINDIGTDDIVINEAVVDGAENGSGVYTDTGIDAADVKKMEIAIGGAALYLKQSEDDSFGIKIDGKGKYQYHESGGVFYLEGDKRKGKINSNEKVYLFIPREMSFQEVEIEVGGGLVEIGELVSDEVDMTAGAGMISAGQIKCRSLEVEVGAGMIDLQGVETEKLNLNVGVGEALIEGNVKKKIDAECGMGVINLVLDNNEKDYDYELECAAGSIDIGGKTYSALAETKINNNANGECELECSMGSISVAFKK